VLLPGRVSRCLSHRKEVSIYLAESGPDGKRGPVPDLPWQTPGHGGFLPLRPRVPDGGVGQGGEGEFAGWE